MYRGRTSGRGYPEEEEQQRRQRQQQEEEEQEEEAKGWVGVTAHIYLYDYTTACCKPFVWNTPRVLNTYLGTQ